MGLTSFADVGENSRGAEADRSSSTPFEVTGRSPSQRLPHRAFGPGPFARRLSHHSMHWCTGAIASCQLCKEGRKKGRSRCRRRSEKRRTERGHRGSTRTLERTGVPPVVPVSKGACVPGFVGSGSLGSWLIDLVIRIPKNHGLCPESGPEPMRRAWSC